MENCLVTKLKAAVANDSLEVLGYEKYLVGLTNASTAGGFKFNKQEKLILLDGTWTANGTREITVAANTIFYAGADTITPDNPEATRCTILVPKYSCYHYANILLLEGQDYVDLTGFKYGSADGVTDAVINMFSNVSIKGLKYVPLANLKFLICGGNNGYLYDDHVDLTQLGAGGNLTSFNISNLGKRNEVYGTLDNLGKSNITWGNTTYFPHAKAVSIDLVNFVANRRAAGATTGNITFHFIGTITVKANGVVLDVPSEANSVLEWTADSITFRGETIS